MNEPLSSDARLESQLCEVCGLCCIGVIFANLALQPSDDAARLGSLGLPVSSPHSALRPPHLAQPCAAYDGCRCRVYADRPQYCRQFECVLFKSVKAGRTDTAAALRIIRTARERADKVRRQLHALGDHDAHSPLSARFRRMGKRLKDRELDEATADTYAQLTLAVHDLNLLLNDAFYPGRTRHELRSATVGVGCALLFAALVLFSTVGPLRADQVELQNGDRYTGHVLSLNTNTVVLQNEMLGTLRLPRAKVAVITLGAGQGTNSHPVLLPANVQPPAPAASPANVATNLSPALRSLGANSNLIQQVQKQFLAGAGDDANSKFNELLGGLMSGKLSVEDIRAQAKAAADQLRALQRESGEDAGLATSAYLAILDRFLKETEPSAGSATNAPTPSAPPKPEPAPDKE